MICLEICDSAVESNCCAHLYCESCSSRLKACPTCRLAPFGVTANRTIRRMIGNLKTTCTLCNMVITRSDLLNHEVYCTSKEFNCRAKECIYKGNGTEFWHHLNTTHKRDVLHCCSQSSQENCFSTPSVKSASKRHLPKSASRHHLSSPSNNNFQHYRSKVICLYFPLNKM